MDRNDEIPSSVCRHEERATCVSRTGLGFGVKSFRPRYTEQKEQATPSTMRLLRLATNSRSRILRRSLSTKVDLVEIPALPILGSLFTPVYTGLPALDPENAIVYWRQMHRDHGPFYTVGVPGFGSGLRGTAHVVLDHTEMLKDLKKEDAFPSCIIRANWSFIVWMNKRKLKTVGFFGRDQEWKRICSFLQKDLLAPQSAREYLGAMIVAPKSLVPKQLLFAKKVA